MVSQANESQTGEGFEEFVNSINELSQKIKKLVIIDTTFLYRHCILEFSQHLNENVATIWFLNNQNTIKKIQCDVLIESYVQQINSSLFKSWYNKIVKDFEMIKDFKKLIMHEAKTFFKKGKGSFDQCLEFLLEEYAHAAAFLKNRNIVYPMPFLPAMVNIIQRYKLNIYGVHYSISNYMRKYNGKNFRNFVNEEILQLLKIKDLKVNWFAITKNGRYIYKNNIYHNIIGDIPYVTDPEAWKISLDIMRKKDQRINEEKAPNGNYYLSVKSPLMINNKVEGIIGLSIDITDKKKKEEAEKREIELKRKIEKEQELYKVAKYVTHDLAQPVTVLKGFLDLNKSLSGEEKRIFKEVARSIENIADRLLIKYRGVKDIKEMSYISVNWCLDKIINQKESITGLTGQREIKFKTSFNCKEQVFIRGNFIDFNRMILNLLNNAEEAIEGEGEIKVEVRVDEEYVEIRVKDNGKGMSKETAEKIERGEKVETMKKEGNGVGTQQINSAVRDMKGKIKVESKEGEGTEIIVTFPKAEKPRWYKDKIEIKKGEEVVILDDELIVHEVWREKLKGYEKEIKVKYFTEGLEALEYIKSKEEKEKIFLIADYDLGKQEIRGVNVIDKSGMKDRHLLVTNMYLSEIKEFNNKSAYLKMFPKCYLGDIILKIN
jgi:signal transduction histidine kinase